MKKVLFNIFICFASIQAPLYYVPIAGSFAALRELGMVTVKQEGTNVRVRVREKHVRLTCLDGLFKFLADKGEEITKVDVFHAAPKVPLNTEAPDPECTKFKQALQMMVVHHFMLGGKKRKRSISLTN